MGFTTKFFINKFLGLILCFCCSNVVFAQNEPNAILHFEQQSEVDCIANRVCYDIQIKTDTSLTLKFYAMNVRFFFDNAYLNFDTLFCASPFYQCDSSSIIPNTSVDIGFNNAMNLSYNILGPTFDLIQLDITNEFNTIATVCFEALIPPSSGGDYCESLVWDLNQDGDEGITFNSSGVTTSYYQNGQSLSLQEVVTPQHNWEYDSNIIGAPMDNSCAIWPCNSCVNFVQNTSNGGGGSLRDVINCVSANDTIFFGPQVDGDTIIISDAPIFLNKSVTLFSHPSQDIVIKTDAGFLFENAAGFNLTLHNINIMAGTNFLGSGIINNGDLKLTDMIFKPSMGHEENVIIQNTGSILFEGNNEILKNEN